MGLTATDEGGLRELEDRLPWLAETRPGRVKRLGFEPTGDVAVGPVLGPTGEQGTGVVRWQFALKEDRDQFQRLHVRQVICAGRSPRRMS